MQSALSDITTANTMGDQESRVVAEVCGFGPVEAAVGCGLMIDRHQPRRVILAGIAGSLNDQIMPGQAFCFQNVALHGIGVRDAVSGDVSHQWNHRFSHAETWLGKPFNGICSLNTLGEQHRQSTLENLLTVCTTASSQSEARDRAATLSNGGTFAADDFAAEDMEGFSVAMTCATRNIPLLIIRGISNVAGQHGHANWKIDNAMQSAAALLKVAVEQNEWHSSAVNTPSSKAPSS